MQLMGDSAKDYKRRLLLAWPAVGEADFPPLMEAQVAAKKQWELLHMPQLESSSSSSAGGPSATNAGAAIMPHPPCFICDTTGISGHVDGHEKWKKSKGWGKMLMVASTEKDVSGASDGGINHHCQKWHHNKNTSKHVWHVEWQNGWKKSEGRCLYHTSKYE